MRASQLDPTKLWPGAAAAAAAPFAAVTSDRLFFASFLLSHLAEIQTEQEEFGEEEEEDGDEEGETKRDDDEGCVIAGGIRGEVGGQQQIYSLLCPHLARNLRRIDVLYRHTHEGCACIYLRKEADCWDCLVPVINSTRLHDGRRKRVGR